MPDIAQYQKKCALSAPLVKMLGLHPWFNAKQL